MAEMTDREMLNAILKNQESMYVTIKSTNEKLINFIAETRNNFNRLNRRISFLGVDESNIVNIYSKRCMEG